MQAADKKICIYRQIGEGSEEARYKNDSVVTYAVEDFKIVGYKKMTQYRQVQQKRKHYKQN